MNVGIITARAGSKSIVDKNVHPLSGRPLVAYPIEACLDAERVEKVYISTDGESIARVAASFGSEVIWRPAELCGDHVNHGDVIKHAVEQVDEREQGLNFVVLLLGNTVMVDAELIDECLDVLEREPEVDSVMTVWESADDHPYRALEIEDGFVRSASFKPSNISTERQSYPRIFYYDQGVWAFRKDCVRRRAGPAPWWWMGEKCRAIVRTWVTGRDIHSQFDVLIAEHYLNNREEFRSLETRYLAK